MSTKKTKKTKEEQEAEDARRELLEKVGAFTKSVKFKEAMNAFKSARPFEGSFTERFGKFVSLTESLSAIAKKKVILQITMLAVEPKEADKYGYKGRSMAGVSDAQKEGEADNTQVLSLYNKLSLKTYLTGWGVVMGLNHDIARKWSASQFKRFFPDDFKKLKVIKDEYGSALVQNGTRR